MVHGMLHQVMDVLEKFEEQLSRIYPYLDTAQTIGFGVELFL